MNTTTNQTKYQHKPTSIPGAMDSWSLRIPTPDGEMFVFILEQNGKIHSIQVNLGKAGLSTSAWAHALATMINFSLAKGVSLADIIAELSGITTAKSAFVGKGVVCRSGPEGIALALMQYQNIQQEKNPTSNSTYKPARFTTPKR